MATDRNKIARNLTPEELQEFVTRCAQVKNLTLAKVQELAGEWGIEVSLMSAKSFRDSTFETYLDSLKRKREMAEMVSGAAQSGMAMSDGAASVLTQKIFDELLSGEDHDIEAMGNLSLALSRLRTGDQRAKLLEAKLREYEVKEEERLTKKKALQEQVKNAKSGGITEETLSQIEEAIGLL